MNYDRLQGYFLLIGLFLVLALCLLMVSPYWYGLVLGIILATVFKPLYKRLLPIFKKETIAALVSVLIVLVVICVPFLLLGYRLSYEAADLYWRVLTDDQGQSVAHLHQSLQSLIHVVLPTYTLPEFSIDLSVAAENILRFVADHSLSIFNNTAAVFLNIVLFLFTLFYAFRDGHALKQALMTLSLLPDTSDSRIMTRVEETINAVIRGAIVLAIVQGFLMGVGLFIFGVPGPVLWGVATAIASLVPGVGVALVFLPASLYLFATGHSGAGIGMLLWGFLFVGLIDNLLRPILLEKRMRVHPFLIFVSVLGGLSFFGPLGLVLGPVALAVFLALYEMYDARIATHFNSNNK